MKTPIIEIGQYYIGIGKYSVHDVGIIFKIIRLGKKGYVQGKIVQGNDYWTNKESIAFDTYSINLFKQLPNTELNKILFEVE